MNTLLGYDVSKNFQVGVINHSFNLNNCINELSKDCLISISAIVPFNLRKYFIGDVNNGSFPLEIRHFSNVRMNQPDQLSVHSLVFKAFAHGM